MLSKHDIAEYYSDPAVRRRILDAVQDKQVLAVQVRGDKRVFRRNDPQNKPINISKATGDSTNLKDLAWYTDRRYADFHEVLGDNTDTVWVDIDPGTSVPFQNVKNTAKLVSEALQKEPEISASEIIYSGGDGFHVRGKLTNTIPTQEAHTKIKSLIGTLAIPNITDKLPKQDEIRLDTSTLHPQGALRVPYSINNETGRVAVPLTERELRSFKPEQAELKRILTQKEFAPGIPRSKRMYALPATNADKTWTLAIQEHLARKAGKHWDLRLVDPDTGYAHSWAIPKAKLPETGGKPLLAVRTPTHTANYALNFGDKGPREISKGYGKGTVEIKHKEPVQVTNLKETSLKFKREDGTEFSLFNTKGDNWMLKKTSAYIRGYNQALIKLGLTHIEARSAYSLDENIGDNSHQGPAEYLANALENLTNPKIQTPPERISNKTEERLNRPTEWEAPVQIDPLAMKGPSRMIFNA
jgi:DNA primase